MKHILVPTDFSKPSRNAALYALGLARDLGAKVTLVHAWHYHLVSNDILPPMEATLEAEANDQMVEFVAGLSKELEKAGKPFPGGILSRSCEGFAVDAILGTAKDLKADLVVMGTHGASGIGEVLLGSNTSTVIQRGEVAVLAVPMNAEYKGIEHLAYATGWREEDNDALKFLDALLGTMDVKIEIVHVMDEGETNDFLDEESLDRAFPSLASRKNVSFRHIRASDTVEGLLAYISSESPELLVMTTHKRGFFGRLFNRSLTEKMANHTPVPLLAIHEAVA